MHKRFLMVRGLEDYYGQTLNATPEHDPAALARWRDGSSGGR